MVRVAHVEGIAVVELILLDPLVIVVFVRHEITLDVHLMYAFFVINGCIVSAISQRCLLGIAMMLFSKTIQEVLVTCLDVADLLRGVLQLWRLGAHLRLSILILSLR